MVPGKRERGEEDDAVLVMRGVISTWEKKNEAVEFVCLFLNS